jgi:hypothetical protein
VSAFFRKRNIRGNNGQVIVTLRERGKRRRERERERERKKEREKEREGEREREREREGERAGDEDTYVRIALIPID